MGSKVLVTGGTGLIGSALIPRLIKTGYEVSLLSRTAEPTREIPSFTWDVSQGLIDPNALTDIDYIIHLAGASVAESRWSPARKKEITYSRVNSTRLLLEQVKILNIPLKAFVCSSAIGFYGSDTGDAWMDETRPKGEGFLADVTNQWENEALNFQELGIRTVCLRTGIVLTSTGGALEKIALPVKFGAGAALGSGNQYMSWIHIEDMCEAYILSLENDIWSGVYNATAPVPVTNSQFTKALGKALKKPIWLPKVPTFSLKLMLGEMASIVLGGNRVSSEKMRDQGMIFRFPELEIALEDLLT